MQSFENWKSKLLKNKCNHTPTNMSIFKLGWLTNNFLSGKYWSWQKKLLSRCQFHQHFESCFCADILVPKWYKPYIHVSLKKLWAKSFVGWSWAQNVGEIDSRIAHDWSNFFLLKTLFRFDRLLFHDWSQQISELMC